jgi:hypothetical protein
MDRRHYSKLLYRDDAALLYARASPPAASLPGLLVTSAAHSSGFRWTRLCGVARSL